MIICLAINGKVMAYILIRLNGIADVSGKQNEIIEQPRSGGKWR